MKLRHKIYLNIATILTLGICIRYTPEPIAWAATLAALASLIYQIATYHTTRKEER